jgi:hypothetical protein
MMARSVCTNLRRFRIVPFCGAVLPRATPFAVAMLSAALFAACSPSYNWREVRGGSDAFVVLLPDKPAHMTRDIKLDTTDVRMSMHGARVAESTFTVGVVRLASDGAAERDAALAAMRTAMTRNIAGTERRSQAVMVPVLPAKPATVQTAAPVAQPKAPAVAKAIAPGHEVEVDGRVGTRNVRMIARFVGHGPFVYQAVAMGPELDPAQARTFLDAFALEEPTQ